MFRLRKFQWGKKNNNFPKHRTALLSQSLTNQPARNYILYPAPRLMVSRMLFSVRSYLLLDTSQSSQGQELYSFVRHSFHSLLSVRNVDEESVANILLFTQSTPHSRPPTPTHSPKDTHSNIWHFQKFINWQKLVICATWGHHPRFILNPTLT